MRTVLRTSTAVVAVLTVTLCLLLPTPAAAWPALWGGDHVTALWDALRAAFDTPWVVTKGGQCIDPDGVPVPCVPATTQSGGGTEPTGASTDGNDPAAAGG